MESPSESTVVDDVYFPPLFPFGFTPSLSRKIEEDGRKIIKTATMSKKTLEKMRRERMNVCIRRLRDLIYRHVSEKERINRSKTNQLWAFHHKWEKADIIELGVELLEESLQRLNNRDVSEGSAKEVSQSESAPCRVSPPQPIPSLTPLIPTQNISHIRKRSCSEIWRPF